MVFHNIEATIEFDPCTGCPKKPHISKTILDGKFETYQERKKAWEIILIPNSIPFAIHL